MAAKNKMTRRQFIKKGLGWAALVSWSLAAGATAVGVLRARSARISSERRARIMRSISDSKLAIDSGKWMPFFEIYGPDPRQGSTVAFIKEVDKFCEASQISLKRFFLTMEKNPVLPGQITALKNANAVYSEQISGFGKAPSEKQMKYILLLREKIARNNRIQSVIEMCLRHKAEAEKLKKTRGSLARIERVKD